MFSKVLVASPPTVDFLSLPEVKTQCAIMENDNQWDGLLMQLVAATRLEFEARLAQAIVPTEYVTQFDVSELATGFSAQPPRGPVLSPPDYPARVELPDGTPIDGVEVNPFTGCLTVPPTPTQQSGYCSLYWYAGMEGQTPENIKCAGKMMVAHLFTHRESVQDNAAIVVPQGAEMMLAASSINGMY